MTFVDSQVRAPGWMGAVLRLAAVYNIVWGGLVVLFPGAYFSLLGIDQPKYLALWQCIGMIVGVFGVGYLIAATNPFRHWPIILVGFLGKIFGPIGFLVAWTRGELPIQFAYTLLTNDLVWWIPFGVILFEAAKAAQDDVRALPTNQQTPKEILQSAQTNRGENLYDLSLRSPVMLVLLRHLGCTFCLESIQQLSRKKEELKRTGVRLVFAHMSPSEEAAPVFQKFALGEVDHISDPKRQLYQLLELRRGTLGQLFGPTVWLRGLIAAFRARQIAGRLQGDGFQMPGIAFLQSGKVKSVYRHQSAAENPDYISLAMGSCPITGPSSSIAGPDQ